MNYEIALKNVMDIMKDYDGSKVNHKLHDAQMELLAATRNECVFPSYDDID